jgi:aspartyl protease family protein
MFRDLAISAVILVVVGTFGAKYLEQRAGHEQTVAPPAIGASPSKPAEMQPPNAASAGQGQTVSIPADARGHYEVSLQAYGVRFPALVDTGASVVALPQSLAAKLGLFPAQSAFTASVTTANGSVKVAPVILRDLRLQGIELSNVEAVIIPDSSLQQVLLGMSFLRRLKSFSIRDNQLTLVN